MNVEVRPIKSIGLAKYNPRKISDQALDSLVQSIERFGFVDPVIVNDRTGILVGGHQRIKAAKKLGLKDVPVVAVNLDEAEEKALNVALNKISGEWDLDLLRGVLEDVQAGGLDLSLTGFTEDEWQAMAGLPGGTVGLTDPDDVPEIDETADTITQSGDLWILGEHRLLCGDSTKADDVERLMAGAKADMVLTGPPYGVAYQTALSTHEAAARNRRKDGKEVANDNLGRDGTRDLVADAFRNAFLKPGGAFYVFCPPGLLVMFVLGLQDAGYNARHQIVWVKDRFVMGRCDYHYRHEVCLYGWADGAGHYFVDDRTQDSVWECKRPGASKDHPTMKPVELFSRCLKNSSKQGWLIYEPFSGSGTTLIAAEQLGRKCYGMEISPQYCDVIVRRWEQFTGRKAVLDAR